MKSDETINIRRLRLTDADDVYNLYMAVSKDAAFGFVSDREKGDISEILAHPSVSASVGAWVGQRLVAYSLCSIEPKPIYPDSPLIRSIQESGEPLWTGKGTMVDREFEGRMLMPRLLKERYAIINATGTFHFAGLIATGNIGSLAGAMRAGCWVVGLETDAYCLNFLCYEGELRSNADLEDERTVSFDDLEALTQLFAEGWIGTAYKAKGEGRERALVLNHLANPAGA